MVERRELLKGIAAAGWLGSPRLRENAPNLTPPAKGKIPVAFLTSERANVIDTAGPWEVFQDVHVMGRGGSHEDAMPFRLFTVAERREAVRMTGGLRVLPDYTLDDAPSPIALEAGFADQAHFTRVFKKHLGVSPGAYRKGVATGARQV
jgi:transcriptional regulator GlxA family with amidase domain